MTSSNRYFNQLPISPLFDGTQNITNFFSDKAQNLIKESNEILSTYFLAEKDDKFLGIKAILCCFLDLVASVKLPIKMILTTHFGPLEACLLHLTIEALNDYDRASKKKIQNALKVIWVDHGYNTKETLEVANKMINLLEANDLNVAIYKPLMERVDLEKKYGGVPSVDDVSELSNFTYDVKLEPFNRALQTEKANVWFTSIRKEQTTLRSTLNILICEESALLKVAPLFYLRESEIKQYLNVHLLPNAKNYYDPTKQIANRECGLHQRQKK